MQSEDMEFLQYLPDQLSQRGSGLFRRAGEEDLFPLAGGGGSQT